MHALPRAQLVALCALLVAYGNGMAWLVGTATPISGWPGGFMGVLLMLATLLWALRVRRLSPAELGLSASGFLPSALVGLLVALAGGVAALLFLRFPPLVGGPIVYAPLADVAPMSLLARIAVWMPLDTVLPEELAFRGALLADLRRHTTWLRASVLSAAVFVAWHAVVVARTLAQTNLRNEFLLLVLGLAGAFGAVFLGGLLFAVLRMRTGNLAASVLAHWGFNTLLLVGLRSV
jgi:membrane protease YdiL (CAAX protease family)